MDKLGGFRFALINFLNDGAALGVLEIEWQDGVGIELELVLEMS